MTTIIVLRYKQMLSYHTKCYLCKHPTIDSINEHIEPTISCLLAKMRTALFRINGSSIIVCRVQRRTIS